MRRRVALVFFSLVFPVTASTDTGSYIEPRFSPDEVALIRSLWIGSLGTPPADSSNRVADDPRAAAFGKQLFFDPRLSGNGRVSCASCHRPDRGYADDRPQSRGAGMTTRNTMTVVGAAWQTWFFWDGRKDSLWSQALGPLESVNEHGGDRVALARTVSRYYQREYEALFGSLPRFKRRDTWRTLPAPERTAISRVFANLGKAIAAWERTLVYDASRFDRYAEAILREDSETARAVLTPDEVAGLRLFIGPARCIQCHNGPLYTNGEFHATGIRLSGKPEDAGRASGMQQVRADEFNCLSPYSDASPEQCEALRYLPAAWPGRVGAFKTPGLRNVTRTAPYMRTGEFATLSAVLDHYNTVGRIPYADVRTEIQLLGLSTRELNQITAFLATLESPVIERETASVAKP